MATTATPNVRLSALPPAPGQAGLRGALASEFTKIRSVRSTYWTLGALFLVSVGLGVLISGRRLQLRQQPGQQGPVRRDPDLAGGVLHLGQLIIAVIGAMVITSEYSTGMIRTSLTAQPRRGVVYAAKAITFAVVTLVVSLVTAFVAFFAGQAVLSGKGVAASLFHAVTVPANAITTCVGHGGHDPGRQRPGLQRPAGDDLLRHRRDHRVDRADRDHQHRAVRHAGRADRLRRRLDRPAHGGRDRDHGRARVRDPDRRGLLPDDWRWDIMRFLPDAANRVVSVTVGPANIHLWSAWPQLGVTALWAAALVGIGAYLFRKRDA